MLSISIDHHLRAVASEKACTGFKRGKHLFVNHQECLIPRVFAALGDLHDAEINDAIGFETQQRDCKERISTSFSPRRDLQRAATFSAPQRSSGISCAAAGTG